MKTTIGAWFALILLGGACQTDPYAHPVASGESQLISDPDGVVCPPGVECFKGQQGRTLLGLIPAMVTMRVRLGSARWDELATNRPALQSVSMDNLGLRVFADGRLLAPEELVGLEFDNEPSGATYRIADLFPADSRGRARYQVEYNPGNGSWSPLCVEGDYAYGIPGWFAGTIVSRFTGSTEDGTFACGISTAAKAVRWGFAPGETHASTFSAAVRLARADYCLDGLAHTIDGTPVVVATLPGVRVATTDEAGESSDPTSEGAFYYEAAWHGRGSDATASNVVIPSDYAVVCLSKLRWQSLPPGGFCPSVLPDPRLTTEFDANRPIFCDDIPGFTQTPTAQFLATVHDRYGAALSSLSQFNDRGLWGWKQSGTSDRFSTTTGFWAGDAHASTRPLDDYAFDGHPVFLAHVLRAEHPGALPLYTYRNSRGDYRTTTNASLANPCTSFPCPLVTWSRVGDGTPIGWVYQTTSAVPIGHNPVALRQWVRPDPASRFSELDSVLWPDNVSPPAGYQRESDRIEGYAF